MQEDNLPTLADLYAKIDASKINRQQIPCIGISVNVKENLHCIADAYVESVIKAGGAPILIPMQDDVNTLASLLNKIDGLIMSGGGDLHPSFFGEKIVSSPESINLQRDKYDLILIKMAADRQIPIFGICRGFQALNIAFGGNIYQDIPSQYPRHFEEHNQTYPREIATQTVKISQDSFLFSILQKEKLPVNSFHHQAIKDLAPEFRATSWTEDGIIEALESKNHHRIWGVQWHPESMATAENEDMLKLFKYFVNEANLFKQAKEIHRKIISIDSHCDTPMFFEQNINIRDRNTDLKIEFEGKTSFEKLRYTLPKMYEGMIDAVFMIAYLHQGERDDISTQEAFEKTVKILTQLHQQIEENTEYVGLACSSKDVLRLKDEGKKAILTGIENAYGIGKDIKNLSFLKEMGVSYITLCHNGNNDICDSVSGEPEHNGLSNFGRELIKEMNRLEIMVDISHTSEKTSFDTIELSKYPVIASHSSVKSLCNHRRNLSDNLIRAIANKNGVVQICLYDAFLSKEPGANITDALKHIDYIVQLVGIDYVGIGSDMDGGGGIPGINSANEIINLTVELLRKRYSSSDIQKIWGGNLMRVMDQVQNK